MPDFELIRSRRKTLTIQVDQGGKLIVRAPQFLSEQKIKRFVNSRRAWVEQRLQEYQRQQAAWRDLDFRPGGYFLLLGEKLPVVVESKGSRLHFDGQQVAFPIKKLYRRRQLWQRWYRQQAREHITERIRSLYPQTRIEPRVIRITSASKQWGSSNPRRGSVNFSWRLILVPPAVVDYVVIHELVHQLVANHSAAFWQQVAKLYPDFQTQRRWLRENNSLLTLL